MADVEEVTSEQVSPEHVRMRVEDWVKRLEGLYRDVEAWMPGEWHVVRRAEASMHEDMMRRFDIPPRRIPALELASNDGRIASLEPRGLWVIGANGRVDLFCGVKHFVLVDRSERFKSSNWQIADFEDRRSTKGLNQESLSAALSV